MKKGMAVEGYIQEDGTVKPLDKYDDTELRRKIQENKDELDNHETRISELESSGGGGGAVVIETDEVPKSGSHNPVESGGVYDSVDALKSRYIGIERYMYHQERSVNMVYVSHNGSRVTYKFGNCSYKIFNSDGTEQFVEGQSFANFINAMPAGVNVLFSVAVKNNVSQLSFNSVKTAILVKWSGGGGGRIYVGDLAFGFGSAISSDSAGYCTLNGDIYDMTHLLSGATSYFSEEEEIGETTMAQYQGSTTTVQIDSDIINKLKVGDTIYIYSTDDNDDDIDVTRKVVEIHPKISCITLNEAIGASSGFYTHSCDFYVKSPISKYYAFTEKADKKELSDALVAINEVKKRFLSPESYIYNQARACDMVYVSHGSASVSYKFGNFEYNHIKGDGTSENKTGNLNQFIADMPNGVNIHLQIAVEDSVNGAKKVVLPAVITKYVSDGDFTFGRIYVGNLMFRFETTNTIDDGFCTLTGRLYDLTHIFGTAEPHIIGRSRISSFGGATNAYYLSIVESEDTDVYSQLKVGDEITITTVGNTSASRIITGKSSNAGGNYITLNESLDSYSTFFSNSCSFVLEDNFNNFRGKADVADLKALEARVASLEASASQS